MAKDESRNARNVSPRLVFRKLPLDGAIVPQGHAAYKFVVNVFES